MEAGLQPASQPAASQQPASNQQPATSNQQPAAKPGHASAETRANHGARVCGRRTTGHRFAHCAFGCGEKEKKTRRRQPGTRGSGPGSLSYPPRAPMPPGCPPGRPVGISEWSSIMYEHVYMDIHTLPTLVRPGQSATSGLLPSLEKLGRAWAGPGLGTSLLAYRDVTGTASRRRQTFSRVVVSWVVGRCFLSPGVGWCCAACWGELGPGWVQGAVPSRGNDAWAILCVLLSGGGFDGVR